MIIYAKEFLDKRDELELDTAAKLYAYTKTKDKNQTYRISAHLREKIQPELLEQAINLCQNRFPSFFVRLENGYAWKKFRTRICSGKKILVEDKRCCEPIDVENGNAPLFRILYSSHCVSLEIFHAVADGHGAMTFLKTLLAVYFNLLSADIPCTNGVLDINGKPDDAELEDSFVKNYDKSAGYLSRREESAYQYVPIKADNELHIKQGRLSVSSLKEITHALNVTVTEYLTAAYIYAIYKCNDARVSEKPIKVQVPIDARPYFSSKTLRNFSLYVNVGITPKSRTYTFYEILAAVMEQLRDGIDKKRIQKMLNTNVRDACMPLSGLLPSFVKKPFINAGFRLFGERLFTSSMSNLGIVDVPNEMKEHIEYFDAVIGETFLNGIWATVVTFGDTLAVTFSSKSEQNDIADFFFKFISLNAAEVFSSNAEIIKNENEDSCLSAV